MFHEQASKDDISKAFRRLSKMFHPDKHIDVKKKKDAENMFNKIKKAHEVLIDANKREIYNRCGLKGLEIEGFEVISRTKSAAEILAELDRYQKLQEERRLQERTNPRGTVTVGINATDIFDSYNNDDYRARITGVEVNSMSLSQTVQCPLTRKDTAILAGHLSSKNGNGQGAFSVIWRRLTSAKGWAEVEVGVGDSFTAGLRGCREISRRCFCIGTLSVVAMPGGLRPGLSFLTAWQLDRNLQGRIILTVGFPSSMRTMLVYEKEETYASLTLQLGVPETYVKAVYSRRFTTHEARLRVAGKIGTVGAYIEYGCMKKISQFSWLGATMVIGMPVGISLRIKVTRGQQTFMFPIKLSEQLMPSAVFYGTAFPMMVYFIVRKLIVDPYIKDQEDQDIEKKKRDHADTLIKLRQEAEAAVELMMGTVERIIEAEENKHGLIITKALYGRLLSEKDLSEDECINVTIPVQVLVKDSNLILPQTKTKADTPGFYDPCPGVNKSLYIQYKFRNQLHETTIQDDEPIRLPLQRHLIADSEGV